MWSGYNGSEAGEIRLVRTYQNEQQSQKVKKCKRNTGRIDYGVWKQKTC